MLGWYSVQHLVGNIGQPEVRLTESGSSFEVPVRSYLQLLKLIRMCLQAAAATCRVVEIFSGFDLLSTLGLVICTSGKWILTLRSGGRDCFAHSQRIWAVYVTDLAQIISDIRHQMLKRWSNRTGGSYLLDRYQLSCLDGWTGVTGRVPSLSGEFN